MLSDLDKAIIRELQEDLPLVPRPYKQIADRLGISEELLLKKIEEHRKLGYIRRFGAALRHRQMGLHANPMIIWQVPEERVEEVGRKLATYPEVTHCYQRPMLPKLQYNVFSMVHCENKPMCFELVVRMSNDIGINSFQLLYSEQEFKKSSMKYFVEDLQEKDVT